MNRYLKYLLYIFLGLIIILIFKSWFSLDLITSGDFRPFTKLQYEAKLSLLYAWNLTGGSGIGGFVGPLLWIYLNFGIPTTIFGKILGLNWTLIERLYYLFPFLILSLYSPFYFFRKIFINNYFAILSSVIFSL